MSTDLEQTRDHARKMAGAEHRPDCRGQRPARTCPTPNEPHPEHDLARWITCLGWCPGCVTDAERALWSQLADEIDAYLAPNPPDDGLFAEPPRQLCDPFPDDGPLPVVRALCDPDGETPEDQ